jgi:hypothetical protein
VSGAAESAVSYADAVLARLDEVPDPRAVKARGAFQSVSDAVEK